jgi:hypothetical protein
MVVVLLVLQKGAVLRFWFAMMFSTVLYVARVFTVLRQRHYLLQRKRRHSLLRKTPACRSPTTCLLGSGFLQPPVRLPPRWRFWAIVQCCARSFVYTARPAKAPACSTAALPRTCVRLTLVLRVVPF